VGDWGPSTMSASKIQLEGLVGLTCQEQGICIHLAHLPSTYSLNACVRCEPAGMPKWGGLKNLTKGKLRQMCMMVKDPPQIPQPRTNSRLGRDSSYPLTWRSGQE